MRHILLTWNPGQGNDEQWTPEEWEAEMVGGTSAGDGYEARWSVGNRVQGIEPGDRAYMLRQGIHGRGIVAIGEITSEPYTDGSWRSDRETSQYVNVIWHEAVPLEERIDVHELAAEIPEFQWNSVYSSGRDITQHGARLEELWSGQVADAAVMPPIVQGAGFGTAEQNQEVEKAAVDYVTKAYASEDYQVRSVERDRCGWDLTVSKGVEEIHVEVKGIAGSLVRFFLTANECKCALSDPKWLLVVVTDALGEPQWYELDGPTAAAYAVPALYQVRVPNELFAV
ncbi:MULTISPECIES: protein NO VEIN domain-containing protein [unclassified Kribbella]|uniref:protein NO VEIN domain-containing protein n=1 Tax=unclassified Kribbella TaxID=2644121 RepID=UPI003076E0E4